MMKSTEDLFIVSLEITMVIDLDEKKEYTIGPI